MVPSGIYTGYFDTFLLQQQVSTELITKPYNFISFYCIFSLTFEQEFVTWYSLYWLEHMMLQRQVATLWHFVNLVHDVEESRRLYLPRFNDCHSGAVVLYILRVKLEKWREGFHNVPDTPLFLPKMK